MCSETQPDLSWYATALTCRNPCLSMGMGLCCQGKMIQWHDVIMKRSSNDNRDWTTSKRLWSFDCHLCHQPLSVTVHIIKHHSKTHQHGYVTCINVWMSWAAVEYAVADSIG